MAVSYLQGQAAYFDLYKDAAGELMSVDTEGRRTAVVGAAGIEPATSRV